MLNWPVLRQFQDSSLSCERTTAFRVLDVSMHRRDRSMHMQVMVVIVIEVEKREKREKN